MKLPKTFMPEKNLDNKVEELKVHDGKPKAIDIEDLMQDFVKIMYEGLDLTKRTYPEIAKKEREVEGEAFKKIIQDTFEDKIKWEEWSKNKYYANACIENASGKEINIPVMFRIVGSPLNATLYLGDERGPGLNTFNDDVKRLAIEYFKMNKK